MANLQTRKLSKLLLIDSLIIFLNLSASYSILPYLIFHQYHRFINALIIVVIDFLFLCIRIKRFPSLKNEPLFWLNFLICTVNLLSAVLTNTGWQYCIAYLALNTMFYIVLCGIFQSYIKKYNINESLRLLTRGYLWIITICLISCISLFVLIKLGFNPLVNPVNTDFDLFKSNYEELGADYYYPYYISILDKTVFITIPFFQEYGVITGIYHEPHIVTFMTFPALFLFLYYSKGFKIKTFIVLCFVLIMLISGSTTNIMATLCCIIIYLLYIFKASLTKSLLTLFILGFIALTIYTTIDIESFQFIGEKMESSSMGYTQVTLSYAFTPKTLMGTSFFNESEVSSFGNSSKMDVGYIKFIINILYLCICYFYLFRLFLSKDKMKLAFLLFASYFFFHSAKVVMVTYSLTMLTFVTFIITQLNHIKTVEYVKPCVENN